MRVSRRLALSLFAATIATTSALAATSGGTLDSTFDGDGRVVTDLGGNEGANAVAVLPDGKILALAATALLRYDSSGAPDATFEEDGVRTFSGLFATDMAIAPDGKIVVVGTAHDPDTLADVAVARFNADGTPDTTFSEDGLATRGSDANEGAGGVAVQADGKIVVVGRTDCCHELGEALVTRFTADGTPDPSFKRGSPFPYGFPDSAAAVALQPNGKIVVAGQTWVLRGCCFARQVFAVARLRTDGTFDTSFSGDGAVRTAFGSDGRSDWASAVAIQADGKIVAGGYSRKGTSSDFALARYTAGGRLDATFSGNGKQRTDFRSGYDAAWGIALQANGRILLVGEASRTFAVARYTRAGRLDGTFSGDGKRRTRFGANEDDYALDVVVQSHGRIVVGGRVTPVASRFDVGLARYLP